MQKTILLLLILTNFVFAQNLDEMWAPHPERKHTVAKRLKLVLSTIRDQKIAILGKSYMKLDSEFQKTVYYNFKVTEQYYELINKFDPNAMETLKSFKRRFKIFSFYEHDKNRAYKMPIEDLVKQIFLIKEMNESISGYYDEISESLVDTIDREDDRFRELVNKVAAGDLSIIGVNLSISPVILNLLGKRLTGKSFKQVLLKDILEIVSPGKDPTSSTDNQYNLEGTSVYLAKKILDKKSQLLTKLIDLKKISEIPANKNLFDFFKKQLHLSDVDTYRFINIANHNHGLEYYLINGVIDLSFTDSEAIEKVYGAFLGLQHLYKIIHEHEGKRAKVSNLAQDHLKRKYHYWAGALVTCELIKRDYNSYLAQFISTKLGEIYESLGNKTLNKEDKNDILLHQLGAEFAANNCM